MPKMKTKRGAAKRFRITRNGKIVRRKANHSHILTKKSRKRKRRLRDGDVVAAPDKKRIKRMLGK